VYALFVTPPDGLPVDDVPKTGLAYIGKSGNLAEREFGTHFSVGASGFSTLRRSVGALMKGPLELMAIPRGTGTSDTNYRNYRFTEEGEQRLSAWMRDHLEVGIAEIPGVYGRAEEELIAWLEPVLCLKGWPNPQAPAIKALRAACVVEARRTVRD
jgi:hypothetical protein